MSDNLEKQEEVVNTETNTTKEVQEGTKVEQLLPEENTTEVIIEKSKTNIENYEVVNTVFNEILSKAEELLTLEPNRTLVGIGAELVNKIADYEVNPSDEKLYGILGLNFKYLGNYFYTFSEAESFNGILTEKSVPLLYDMVGNKSDIEQQLNIFTANMTTGIREKDLVSLLIPLAFNLSNIGTNIACSKCVIAYGVLRDENKLEDILNNILQAM